MGSQPISSTAEQSQKQHFIQHSYHQSTTTTTLVSLEPVKTGRKSRNNILGMELLLASNC
jgi:hypothetical protein